MERNVSSSEQYVKKSNRRLLLIGLLILAIVLIVMMFAGGKRSTTQQSTPLPYIVDSLDNTGEVNNDVDLFERGNASLKVEPEQVEMKNVVIGSQAETIVTLSAENTPILFLEASFSQQQQDGFELETTCEKNETIQVGNSCILKILWNPVSLRQLQNPLVVRWKEDSQTSFKEQKTTIMVTAQSTDSKDCIICQNAQPETKEPKYAMGLDGQLHEVGEDGGIVINGERIIPTADGLYVDKNGNIVAIAQPEMIALGLNNEIIGSISAQKDVISASGDKLGRLLGDNTIVDVELNVVGAAVPVVSVMDNKGTVIAKLLPNGTAVNAQETVVGKVTVDGTVLATDGTVLGVLRPWGLVADFSGKIIGGIVPDGSVRDAKSDTIAQILPNGLAVTSTGELIGGTLPQGAAVGAACQSIGSVLANGVVKDVYDQEIAHLLIDGSIVDAQGKDLGAVVSQGPVINEKGAIIGFVNSEGKAVGAKGSVIGCINPDGSIFAGKRSVGAVMPHGRVVGYGCNLIGSVYPDGTARKPDGTVIGKVMPDKYVKDDSNKIIGAVVERSAAIAEGCRLLGLVSITGHVIDLDGNETGCVTPDKDVVDEKGEKIGTVITKGTVVDAQGNVIGRLRLDGKVMDNTGKVIGCINPDGTVTTLDGQTVLGTLVSAGTPLQSGAILDANGNPTGWSAIGNKVFDINATELGLLDQDGLVTSADGKFLGIIPSDGTVISADGLILGRYSSTTGYAVNQEGDRFGKVLPDGTVISGDNVEILGSLIPDKATFMRLDGSYLGAIRLDGTIKDETDAVLGAVHANGTVTSKDGEIIGMRIPRGKVLSLKGEVLGSVNEKGEVVSLNKAVIGFVTGEGIAVSQSGKVLGGVFNRLSLAFGADGFLGYPKFDGTVVDKSGTQVGRVTPFGLVVNDTQVIGRMTRIGVYLSPENKLMGWTSFDGDLTGKEGGQIGRLYDNGTAYDKTNHFIAYLAQKGLVRDINGKFKGYMSVDNRLLDAQNTQIGSISASMVVYNDTDEAIGQLTKPGVAVDTQGAVLGYLRSDATIGDKSKVMAYIWFDNTVVNNKGEIVASYIPFDAVAYTDDMQAIGFVNEAGDIIAPSGQKKANVASADMVSLDNAVTGRLLTTSPFIADNLSAKMLGVARVNGESYQMTGSKALGSLSMNKYALGMTKQVIGAMMPLGAPVSHSLNSLGRLLASGTVILKGQPEGQVSGIGGLYNQKQTLSGAILPNTAFIGKNGLVLGKSSDSVAVTNRDGKKVATQTVSGLALSDKLWAGGKMSQGVVVDDYAVSLGVIGSDGAVVDKDKKVVARVLGDMAAAQATNRELYNPMPYVGAPVAQGLPYSYRGSVLGRTTVNGDVVDADDKKIFRILDDATILGKDEPLAGAILPFLPAVADSGNVLGVLTGEGTVVSSEGENAGKIAVNGAVKASEYEILGALIPTTLVTNECQIVGSVALNGQVIDANGTVLGRIQRDKWAVNTRGTQIGRVSRIGIVVNEKGEYLGRTLPDSTVIGTNGVNIGCSHNDGTVYDLDGHVIGATKERGLVLNANGEPEGRVLANGQVVNSKGEVIGRLTSNDTVIDEMGNVIGHMVSKDQELLFDEKGRIKGTFGTDGSFYDPKTGKKVFKVGADGNVYDPNGNLIGKIKDGEFTDLKGNKVDEMTVLVDKDGNVIGIVSGCNIVNAYGEKLGTISPDGNIIDLNGEVFAKILGDGTLLDKDGNPLGNVSGTNPRLDKCGIKTTEAAPPMYQNNVRRELRDADGNLIGYIDENGNIYDKDGNLIGTVDANGVIRDTQGNIIGRMDAQGNMYDAEGNLIGKATVAGDSQQGGAYASSGRGIFIGNKVYSLTDKGSILNDDGIVIGYMGEDGKPYTLDNRLLTASGDSQGRVRPNVHKPLTASPAQVAQMQQELQKRRSEMKTGIQGRATIKPSKRIQAMGRKKQDKNWKAQQIEKNVSSYPVDMSRMILRDKAIPAVLVHSIDSRYSTVPVTAIVERHIYSETGRNIIIPAGSRLIGDFAGEQGSTKRVAKLEITWKRLIRPDGGSFSFQASSGDAQGRGGISAYLDEQLVEKFGKPIMSSVITSAVSYMMATNDEVLKDANTDETTTSARSEAVNDARKNFIDAMQQIFDRLLQDAAGIEPVIFVPSGTRLTVFSNEDLWLRSEEDDMEEVEDDEDVGIVQGVGGKSWVDTRMSAQEEDNNDQEEYDDEELPQKDSSGKSADSEEDYYKPNTSGNFNPSSKPAKSENAPVYNGNNSVQNKPSSESLKTRRAEPVLPKTGQGDRLF